MTQTAMSDKDKKSLGLNVNSKLGNVHNITIADFDFTHFDAVLDVIEHNYDFWAYVIHDKDEGANPHYHVFAQQKKGGSRLTTHQALFEGILPPNFICKVNNPRAMCKYLIHRGWVGKYQYSPDEVFSNDKGKYLSMLDFISPSKDVWLDYRLVMQHKLSVEDFINKYSADFASMPFYQKLSIYHKLLKDC